jgi:cytoskeleton protein RodZ
LPAPVESNAPPHYLTPGLEAELSAALPPGMTASEDPTLLDLGETFTPRAAVHGAAGRVVLQARRPTTLIVWGPDRSAWFARQLAAGEAYRTDPVAGLSFESVEAGVIAVYLDGQSRGVLPAGLTPASVLTRPPPA